MRHGLSVCTACALRAHCVRTACNIRYSGVQAALIGAVMRTNFEIEKLSMCSRRTTLIPNHNIGGGSGHKVTNPYYIPEIVHRHGYLVNVACVLGIK